MEKYARQAVSEGVKSQDDLHVGGDSEIYRVLNLHYNRNNHIEVSEKLTFTSFFSHLYIFKCSRCVDDRKTILYRLVKLYSSLNTIT